MTDGTSCLLCGNTQEIALHVLRDYTIAKGVWMKLLSFDIVNSFFAIDFEDWLHGNLEGRFKIGFSNSNGPILFAVQCWLLWKNRNRIIFELSGSHMDELLCAAE